MAVIVAGVVESLRTGTTDPHTWTHNAGTASPQGVLVAILHGDSATDHAVSVTYGGVALSRRSRHTDTATEAGAAEWWFLGSSVPTGSQTVSVDLSTATVEDIHFVSITLDANDDVEVVDEDGLDANVANPSVTLQYQGRTCMAFAAFYSGLTAIGSITAGTNCTLFTTSELAGNYASVCLRQTTAGSSDFAIAATAATDDVAYAALAVSEVQKITPPVAAVPLTLTGVAPTVTIAPPVVDTSITPLAGLLLLTQAVSVTSMVPSLGALAITGVAPQVVPVVQTRITPGGFTFTVVASGSSAANSGSYSVAVTLAASRQYVLAWAACDPSGTPAAPTITDDLPTPRFWYGSDARSAPYNTTATPRNRVGFHTTITGATAGLFGACTITFTYSSTLASHCFALIEIAGSNQDFADLRNSTVGSADSGAASLTYAGAFFYPEDAAIVVFASDDADGTSAIPDFTPDADFTVLTQPAISDGTASMRLVVIVHAPQDLNPNGTWSVASTDWGGHALEAQRNEYAVPPFGMPPVLTVTGVAPTVTISTLGDVAITPAAGTLTLTGAAPTVGVPVQLTPPAGSLTLTGAAPIRGLGLIPSTGAITLTGAAPTKGLGVVPSVGSLTLSGATPTKGVGIVPSTGTLTLAGAAPIRGVGIIPSTGTLTLTGAAPARGQGLSPSAGTLTLTGAAPLVQLALFVTPGAGVLTLTGQLAQIEGAFSLAPLAGVLTLTGAAPALAQPVTITPGAGVLTLTGQVPSALAATFRTPLVGALTLTGLAPTRLTDARPMPTAGVLTLTGQAPSASTSTLKSPPAGSLALTGATPGVGRTIVPGTGALAMTGAAPALTFAFARQPAAGILTLTGYQPSAVDSGAGVTNRQTLSGTLVLTGQAPVLSTAFSIQPTVGTLTLAGQAPSLSRSITPAAGALAITGAAPSVSSGRLIQPQLGALALAGIAPTLLTDRRITPAAGALTVTGVAPTFLSGTVVIPATGALTLAGQAPSLLIIFQSPQLTPGTGQLELIGIAPVLSAMVSITPGAGVLTLTGYAPTRVDSGSGLGSIVIADTKTLQPVNGTRSLQVINDTVSLQPNRRVREIGTLEPVHL